MRMGFLILVMCCASVGEARALQAGAVYKPGDVVSPPRIVREVKPQYTVDAMKAKVQGVVELEFVVRSDGTVGDVTVVRSLHDSLDREAIKAVKQWRFKPGMRNGTPVAVPVGAELTFTLRDSKRQPSAPASGRATPAVAAETEKAIIYKPGDGVIAPRLVHEVRPVYPPASRESKTQGSVRLESVVNVDGTVGDIRVVRSLDASLDLEAVNAVKQWKFEPGVRDGKPVPVQVTIELTFTLR